MSSEPDLRALLAPMAEREVELSAPAFRVDRERVLARMAQAKAQPRRGWLGGAALAAAGVAIVILGARIWQQRAGAEATASLEVISEGTVTQIRGAAHDAVASDGRIAAAGELDTGADSQARVRTKDGLQIELKSQTRVALGELQPSSSQLKLLGGAIRCTIPHRSAAHAFQVVTADVTVVDLGTVFTVSVEGPNHATRVSVEEGEVLVRHAGGQLQVQAPGSWSSADVAVLPSAAPVEPAVTATASVPSSLEPAPSTKGSRSMLKPPAATLEQEAQLLRQGLAAERQGRATEAISALSELLQKYPNSPLVPDARAALARVEAGTSR